MRANDVLKLLRITRPTLTKYVKTGILKVKVLPNGRYDYDDDSVYAFFSKDSVRHTGVYVKDFNILPDVKKFCMFRNYLNIKVYESMDAFLNDLCDSKIERLVIQDLHVFDDTDFKLLKSLFMKFHCSLIIMEE